MAFSVNEFRKKFPQLESQINGHPLVYFDNGASTLKHSSVTERVNAYNRFEVSNVHRGAHSLSQKGTEAYEQARKSVQNFLGASSDREIIFTRGTTESINLVSQTVGPLVLNAGDEVLISSFEHHSNIVPWQILCEKLGCHLKVVEFDRSKGFSWDHFINALNEKTKIFSFLWYSNSFGNRLPVENLVEECRKRNIVTFVDAAQTVLTEKIDVQKINCDFLAFSGHKIYGPYGIGALYGKAEWLEKMEPYQGGGSMIDRVTFEGATYADIPQKFEAGTPNVAGAVGLGEAVSVFDSPDFSEQHTYVLGLRNLLKEGLMKIPECEVYEFESEDYAGVVSFNLKGAHPSDVGTLLDKYGIAVRAGHHCTQPLMGLLGIEGTVRASLSAYNTESEVRYFLETMNKVKDFF